MQEEAAVWFVKLLLSPVPNIPHLDKYLAQSSGPTILVKRSSAITTGINAVTSGKTNLEVAQTAAGHYFRIDL